uniref:Uncharacterized protein n=1 Tax=Arundo donax TaxID=35708 RepID=A0A0A9GNZ3_ARUDO
MVLQNVFFSIGLYVSSYYLMREKMQRFITISKERLANGKFDAKELRASCRLSVYLFI